MFASNQSGEYARAITVKWLLLAFAGGCINAGGFLSCQRFVSHVTGFATLFGVDLAKGQFREALGLLSVPGFFLLGAMVSAFFIDMRAARGLRPYYGAVLGTIALILVSVTALGVLNTFGVFGAAFLMRTDYSLVVLLCLASGLQNAAISHGSGMMVRTTHLTGITTDLGTGLVKLALGHLPAQLKRREAYLCLLRAGLIVSFGLGGAIGASLFLDFQYLGFLLPAGIAAYVGMAAERGARAVYPVVGEAAPRDSSPPRGGR